METNSKSESGKSESRWPDNMTAVSDLARKAVGTEINAIKRARDNGDVPVLIVDKGRDLHGTASIIEAFEKTQPAPYRRRGTFKAGDVESLLRWMEGHCDTSAPVFAEGAESLATNWPAPRLALVGIGNYSSGTSSPAWHDFRARYEFPVTAAWSAWVKDNSEWMDQGEFAEFVEEHLYEFSKPERNEDIGEACTRMIEALGGSKMVGDPSAMYEVGNGVKLNVKESIEVAMDRGTGEAVMRYTEEHTGHGGRPVKIPKFFYIRVPVFFGEEPSLIGALLRYRNAGGGKVVWSYQLFAPDLVVKAAFDKACGVVKRASRTLYLGSPDAPV